MTRRSESGLPEAGSHGRTGRRTERGQAIRGQGPVPARLHAALLAQPVPVSLLPGRSSPTSRWQEEIARQWRPGLVKVRAPAIPDIAAHYQRLTPDDLRTRFGRVTDRGQLMQHAEEVATHGAALGILAEGRLAALMESFLIPGTGWAEVAFSVEQQLQGQYVGWRLLAEAMHEASCASLQGLTFQFAASNAAMMGLARHAGAMLHSHGSEIVGELRVGP